MKKNLLSIVFLFCVISVSAVNLSWSVSNLSYANNSAVDIKQNSNGIYALMRINYPGTTFNNGDSDRIYVVRYNTSGNILNSCYYDYLSFAKQDPKSLLLDNSGNVYVLFTNTGTTGFTEYFILKLNFNLTTQLDLLSPNLGSNQRQAGLMRFADNNTSIIISTYVNYPTDYATEFTKIDLNGNQIWNYSYHTNYYSRPFILDFKIKKGRVICCGRKLKGTNTTTSDIWVLALNAGNGVFKFEHTFTSTFSQIYYADHIEGDDSKNIYLGGQSFQTSNKSVWFMAKLDSLGNEKWTKKYEPINNYAGPLAGLAMDSKNKLYYLGIADMNGTKCRLLKLDDAGNQVWAKIIKSGQTLNEWPIDIKISSSDKIYFAAYQGNGSPNTHLYQYDESGSKLDEDTCNFSGRKIELFNNNVLAMGVGKLATVDVPAFAKFNANPIRQLNNSDFNSDEKPISVYPNPASTEINFICDDTVQRLKISIYNTRGTLIKQSETTPHKPFPVYDLQNGCYSINVSSNQFNKTFKLIIKH